MIFPGLNGRRVPSSQQRSQRNQDTLPAENTTTPTDPAPKPRKLQSRSRPVPNSYSASDASRGRNTSFGARSATEGSERDVPPRIEPHEGEPITSTPRHTAGGMKSRTDVNIVVTQKDREKSAMVKPHSSAISASGGERELNASRRAYDKPHSTKTFAFPFIGSILLCGKHSVSMMNDSEPNMRPSTTQRHASHSQALQHEDKSISTPAPTAGGAEQKSADTRVAENISTELGEIGRLRQELSISHSRIAELQHRRESQHQAASNGFLDIADTSSDTDVIRAVQRLNAEMQQNATYMADSLVQDFEFRNVATEMTQEYSSVVQRVSGHIGPALAKSMGSRPQEVPLLLQIAFQAYLTVMLGQTASAWTSDPGHSSFMDSIYQTLRGAEAQATSGRWRSLARLYNHHHGVCHLESFVARLIADLSDVLLVTGCTSPRSDIISKMTSKFKERIALLVGLAVRLNKIFGEVISSDFEILLVRPGDRFENDNMEETDGARAVALEGSAVLCATHLGLTKRTSVGTLWEKGIKQKMLVLKAKVLLESLLDAED